MSDKPAPDVIVIEDLLDLVTAQHSQQPRYMQTVALSVRPYIAAQNTGNSYWTLFDLDTSVGQQEDMLGEWVGITRYVPVPLQVFFTLDDNDLGFDLGRWHNPYEVDEQMVRLDDEPYRLLLRARIAANYWDGTIPGAYAAWDTLFAGTGTTVLIQDGFPRGDRYFTFDDQLGGTLGFDRAIWWVDAHLAHVYFSLDDPDPALGFDQGQWFSNLTAYYVSSNAITHGNMHIIQALVGAPVDAITQALFTGGKLGLKSAGVGVTYVFQYQKPGPDYGVGLPLFALDAGPDIYDLGGYWVSFDIEGLGHDEAPLFYPGAYPIDKNAPRFLLNANDPANALDHGYWGAFSEPDFYLTFDGTRDEQGFDYAQWLGAGALPGTPNAGSAWFPPPWPVDRRRPSTGVTQPPTNLAGFDYGAWGWQLTTRTV